jgi:bifunctional DNA-binding transcriptional regulator/antitoxin component of YhaV-PrlF toxin-antitoxin module
MPRKPLEERNVRKLTKVGKDSYAVTIPIEMIRELGWRERQNLEVVRFGEGVRIIDWEEK